MKYDYDPIPLSPPDPLDPEEMLRCATQHYEHISRRRTVRHFSSESISRDIIEACILTAGSAPSGANHQPWHFVCVSDPQIKHQIRLAAEAEERALKGAVGSLSLRAAETLSVAIMLRTVTLSAFDAMASFRSDSAATVWFDISSNRYRR